MPLPTPENKKKSFAFPPQIASLLKGVKLYCSFSGGADSLSLLLFLSEQREFFSYTLRAVHFEHGFRGEESLADEHFCRTFCAEHQIPFESHSLAVPEHKLPGEGDEEAARRLRLKCWEKIVSDPDRSLIVLGHHAYDRVENVLLRLFRGSNASGLTSLRYVQTLHGLTFIRPFLDHTREELLEFLQEHHISAYCHDSTNDSPEYGRNFIRLKLLKDIAERFPFALCGIRRSVSALQEDARCLELLAEEQFRKLEDPSRLEIAFLKKQHKALRIRMLTLFLHQYDSLRSFLPDRAFIENFEALLRSSSGEKKIPLHGEYGVFLMRRHGAFSVCFPEKETEDIPEMQWDVITEKQCGLLQCEILSGPPGSIPDRCTLSEAFFDLDQLALPLTVRHWKAGDRMIPFGRRNSVPLKKLFADQSISSSRRKEYPLVCDRDGRILFAAGLRHSSQAPVTADSSRILHIILS